MPPSDHTFTERRSPSHILLTCSCGWRTQITRRQNALARSSKVRSAQYHHLLSAFKAECANAPAIEDLL